MKALKTMALLSSAALLAACGTATAGWKEVSQEKFLEEVTAVEDYQYAVAHVTGKATATETIEGSGEQLDSLLSMMGMELGSNTEETEIDYTFNYTEDGWVCDDPDAAAAGIEGDKLFMQMNYKEAYKGLIVEETSEEETTEEETTEEVEIVPVTKFYSGKGWKIDSEVEGMGKTTMILDEKAYIVANDTDINFFVTQDFTARGYDAVITMSMRSVSTLKIAYSGEYAVEA